MEDSMNKKTILLVIFIIIINLLLSAEHASNEMYDENGNLPANFNTTIEEAEANTAKVGRDDFRNVWQGVGPWGGDVTSLAISLEVPTTIYAALGNPYISTDSGET
jgi:hypothetical protein